MAGNFILEISDFETPPVAAVLTLPAEFAFLQIGLRSSRKTNEEREQEIAQTMARLFGSAKTFPPLEASAGSNFKRWRNHGKQLFSGGTGASGLSVHLRVPISETTPDIRTCAALMQRFLNAFDFGKVECTPGEVSLEISNPERFRTDVLKVIQAECARCQDVFGTGSKIHLQINGLANHVKYVQTDATTLALYIDHSLSIHTD